MLIWSFQPKTIINDLKTYGVYHCAPKKSQLLEYEEFEYAYGWLMNEMDKKIKRPNGVLSPIWGWSKNCASLKNGRPDLRKHNTYNSDYVLLELEISEERLLESCFDKWHVVLNNCYYTPDDILEGLTDDEWNEMFDREKGYSKEKIESSWIHVFDVENSCCKQVTFWEILPEDVKKIHYINRR